MSRPTDQIYRIRTDNTRGGYYYSKIYSTKGHAKAAITYTKRRRWGTVDTNPTIIAYTVAELGPLPPE